MSTRMRRLAAAVLTGALSLGGLAMAAGPASAGTGGGGGHGFEPQVFLIHQEGANATTGAVKGFGPIEGRGVDVTGNSTDQFIFPRGTVTVAHQATSDKQGRPDRRSCTVTVFERGTWQITDGTGKYWGAQSKDGRYSAVIVLFFHRHHHHCKISGKSQPDDATIDVFAAGKVKLAHQHD